MTNKDNLPPMTDYMRNCLRNQYVLENPERNQDEIINQHEIVLVVDEQICDDMEEVKNKLNNLIISLGHNPLTDDEFNILFLRILDLNPGDIL